MLQQAEGSDAPLLSIADLIVEFATADGPIRAVNGVSYTVNAGETVAVVGESGSGKSVTALALLGLLPSPPARVVSGSATFAGQPLLDIDDATLRHLRGNRIGMIFQEPMTSLNPLLSIGTQVCEGMRTHLGLTRRQAENRAVDLLNQVGIAEPLSRLRQYPHQFSGGMRQRVMIAMALACEPQLIIADEPTTALDVTIQAQILELLRDLSRNLNVAVVLITHNLGIVARYADWINVMYAGRVVESGSAEAVFASPAHPYTRGLIGSVPRLDSRRDQPLRTIEGQPPDPGLLPAGCAYSPRCSWSEPACESAVPALENVRGAQRSACRRAALVESTPFGDQ